MMTFFEEQLKEALKRQEPAADFTARVMARCAQKNAQKRRTPWGIFSATPAWRLPAMAAAVARLAGGTAYQEHEHNVRGLEAKRKVMLAMRIAGTKLQEVQKRVADSAGVGQ